MPDFSHLEAPTIIRSRKKKTATSTRTAPEPEPEERWWFPGGSITRDGKDGFLWHGIGKWPVDFFCTIRTNILELRDGAGFLLQDSEEEYAIDHDPSQSWYDNLPPFPYAHVFYDVGLDFPESDLDPWFCMHGIYRSSREELESECASSL